MNTVTVQYVTGGFVLSKLVDGKVTTEVFTSVAKLNKALRAVNEELSLVPKSKKDEADE
jgi:hypothetical protein